MSNLDKPFTLSKALPWLALLLLAALPMVSGPYFVYLVTLSLIFSIFAFGYDVLFGHTGIVSFGHSIFYGMAAYAVGMVSNTVLHFTHPLILTGTALATGIVLGALVGWICTYSRGIYLAIVTFALAQIFELLVLSDPGGITLGENSITAVRPPPFTIGDLSVNLFAGTGLYYLSLLVLVLVYLGVKLLANSHWGQVFHAIRENEERLLSLGYNTRPYKILAFALSGGLSAIAGSLMAFLNNIVSPSMVDWSVGAEILLITVLGGAGTLAGPILGAFVVVLTQAFASSLIGGGNWVYVLGGLYIVVAIFLPGGIMARLPRLLTVFDRSSSVPATLKAADVKPSE